MPDVNDIVELDSIAPKVEDKEPDVEDIAELDGVAEEETMAI